jgi:hypothetical protein
MKKRLSDYENGMFLTPDYVKRRGGKLDLTVEQVREEEMPKTKNRLPVAWFPEAEERRGLTLGAKVNRDALAKISGCNVLEEISNVRIQICIGRAWNPTKGEEVDALRIRKAPDELDGNGPTPPYPSQPREPAEAAHDPAEDDEIPY